MKVAEVVFAEEAARRDNLDDELLIILTLSLAQIGHFPVPDQGLEHRLSGGAANVQLNVPAARRAPRIVGGAAGRRLTGTRLRYHGKGALRPGGRKEPLSHETSVLDDGELITPQTSRGGNVCFGSPAAGVSMRRASGGLGVVTRGEKAAWNMDARIAPEFALALEHRPEVDAFGMAEEPGRVVIFVAVDGGYSNCDVECLAMPAKAPAWWRRQRSSDG